MVWQGMSCTISVNVLLFGLLSYFHELEKNASCTGACTCKSVCVRGLHAFSHLYKMCLELQGACCCKRISLVND